MVSVSEATAIIQNNLWKGTATEVPLLQSLGRVLAENIVADRDFPPFNRVTMDGIAIAFQSFEKGEKTFSVQGLQAAGMPVQKLVSAKGCLEVMTGAMLPEGTDTVIRYEDLKIENGKAQILIDSIRRGDSIHKQGHDAKRNDVLLSKGKIISPAEIPLLASVGKSNVMVSALPKVAVVSTGDELVDIADVPQLHQIRKSNVYALAAGLAKYGIVANFFHLEDNEASIQESLKKILSEHDLIILSGGVSKGKFDLIPQMLESFGIQKHFYQVKQRPGKPMWFGTGSNRIVFALPGNPVSTFLCFYQYIEPWLLKSLGDQPSAAKAILDVDFKFDLPLTYFLQAKIKNDKGQFIATPVPGGGSGDFVNLKDVDGFLELPEGVINFKKGESFNFISFRG
jgi:molybdopterin molybdotransferase